MYSSTGTFSAEKNEALYAFARAHGKPYALPEFGLVGGDFPEFIRYICTFIRNHARIELAAYYEAKAGSIYDLGTRSNGRQAYRACITPLGR